ncbi:unnamed protein product [Victoria cruziana]
MDGNGLAGLGPGLFRRILQAIWASGQLARPWLGRRRWMPRVARAPVPGQKMARNRCYLVDPASSHMLVSKIKPCMFKKLVLGFWVGPTGPPLGVHRLSRPFYRRYAPGLNWPGRASGAVTLKKLECSKQAYALYTLAWDNITGFRSYCVGLRDRSND